MFANKLTQKFTKTLVASLFLISLSTASTYYVATTGSNTASGSITQPFATIQKAQEIVLPGDTVFIREGVFKPVNPDFPDAGISLHKSGGSDSKRIHYWAYPGEKPVFDFSSLKIRNGDYTHGIVVTGSWLHLKGLEIRNVPMTTRSNVGLFVKASGDNIFELLNLHHNYGSGVFVDNSKGVGGHLFLNCDSHDNYDPNSDQGDGQNADGFGVHYQKSGRSIIFRGCRAWWNSDDGWDFISQEVPVIIENSWAMGHGFSNYGTGRPSSGNGNGFKAGSSKTGIRHIIRNSVAWKNKASGFYANHSSGGNDWINNTSYSNGTSYNLWASTWDANDNRTDGVVLTGNKAHYMRNNIAFPLNNKYMEGVNSQYNTWDLNIVPKTSDFISVTDPSMTVTGQDLSKLTGAFGPRQANGDLPDIDFLKLSQNSQMIDKGVDVGLVAINKPDLGAYEFGMNSTMFDIETYAGPGGIVQQSPAGSSLKEGSKVVFTAVPLKGWVLDSWSGSYAGKESAHTIERLTSDVSIRATFRFIATDSNSYEGENAMLVNAVVEAEHTGFFGEGYANLDNITGSSIEFAIVTARAGTKKISLSYSNGSTTERPTSVSVNGVKVLNTQGYPITADWDTWKVVQLDLNLTAGVNTITFVSTTDDGGPNFDRLQILDETSVGNKDVLKARKSRVYYDPHEFTVSTTGTELRLQLFAVSGAMVFEHNTLHNAVNTEVLLPMSRLNAGVYLLKVKTDFSERAQVIKVLKP